MDKKLAVGCTSALSCAGGGGYLLYSQLSSSEVAVETETSPAPNTKPAVANAQPEVLPPLEKKDVPIAKPVNPIPPKQQPPVVQPKVPVPKARPGSVATQSRTTYQSNTIGSVFKDYLLDTEQDSNVWDAKVKKIESKTPNSINFKAISSRGFNKKVSLKSNCGEAYTYQQSQWNKPKSTWTDDEPKKYWDDVWNYCSANDNDPKPQGWPLA